MFCAGKLRIGAHIATQINNMNFVELFRDNFAKAVNRSVVAFQATLQDGGSGVFTATEGEITTIMDMTGPFESFRGVLLDSEGRLVFYARPRGGELGNRIASRLNKA